MKVVVVLTTVSKGTPTSPQSNCELKKLKTRRDVREGCAGTRNHWSVVRSLRIALLVSGFALTSVMPARGERPGPVLQHIFPAGGRTGSSIAVTVSGTGLDGLTSLRFADPRISVVQESANGFRITIPEEIRPGSFDVRAVGSLGVSGPRIFVVGNAEESLEIEPNDNWENIQPVPAGNVVNGKFDKPGDIDCYGWTGVAGELVVVDLKAERIDSPAHAVIEISDASGRRLAVNRGFRGIDPRIDFRVPSDGEFRIRVFDQTYVGNADSVYRLEIRREARVDFAMPMVMDRSGAKQGEPVRVTLFGRNLLPDTRALGTLRTTSGPLDSETVDLIPQRAREVPEVFPSRQTARGVIEFDSEGKPTTLPMGVTDIPVVVESTSHATRETAQKLSIPSEVCGQLIEGNEKDWYAFDARKGEALWIEAYGERIGSPVDLDFVVLTAEGKELLHGADEVENLGGVRFPTNHSDPAGRFLAPADGRFFVMLRNVTGGIDADPTRVYRLSVRREDPDFQLILVPRRTDQPTGINVPRAGREWAELLVLRHRGFSAPIEVKSESGPSGIEVSKTWIGPGQVRGLVVLAANGEAKTSVEAMKLSGRADVGGSEVVRRVRGGTMVRTGHPTGWGRFTEEVPVAVAPECPLRLSATPPEAKLFQESILDVMVDVDRGTGCEGPIEISGVGLPQGIENAFATIPSGETRGWLSFAIPGALTPGPYTFAVQAETDVMDSMKKENAVTTVSNPITIHVESARIRITVDPKTPRKIARGKVIQVRYRAERLHGFIGKIHTELAAPGGVTGIRGRGVTFTSQQETGDIQVIATENATPGRMVSLRLHAVGTVEDQPVYHAGRFLELEITE